MGKCLFLRKGETHTAPISGILANTLAVGSTVKLIENGAAAEYLVVHQGLPSSMYDASCDGTWLLRKGIYGKRQWHSSAVSNYSASTIHSYLNSTFLNLFGETEQFAIMQVKIPYQNGTGSGGSVAFGANGLSTKVFLLSGYEVGREDERGLYLPMDGAFLSYFYGTQPTDSKRIGYLNGTATDWWLRSPSTAYTSKAFHVYTEGQLGASQCDNTGGIRPALILPSTALFDKNTLILKGVA